jgi:hypothetical protein
VPRRFTECPGERQQTYDRCDDRRAEHAETEDEAPQGDAEMGYQCLAYLSYAAQRAPASSDPIVVAATNTTEALTTCVNTAPKAVSLRAAP